MERRPGRETRAANSRIRRTWYGYGKQTSAEKNAFGVFLHDLTYVFGEISIFGLPALFAIALAPWTATFGPRAAGLVAWTAMVGVAAGIRGGSIAPIATDALGWVSLSPWLAVVRIAYYNLVLFVAAFGGSGLATLVGVPPLSVAVALAIAIVATLAFPALAERAYGRLAS